MRGHPKTQTMQTADRADHADSFSIVGAKIWNSIPESYRRLPKHVFKKTIQALLHVIVTLKTLDSYADILKLKGMIGIIQSLFILFFFTFYHFVFPLLTNVIKIDFFNALQLVFPPA